jgi:hypothetical protein
MYPVFTGDAARLIGTTERRLNELIRDGQIIPPPRILGGRRLWEEAHVRQAADVLGLRRPAGVGEEGQES